MVHNNNNIVKSGINTHGFYNPPFRCNTLSDIFGYKEIPAWNQANLMNMYYIGLLVIPIYI